LVPAFGEKKFFFQEDQEEVNQESEHKVVHMLQRHDADVAPVVLHSARQALAQSQG
jgi:hypothetical protein